MHLSKQPETIDPMNVLPWDSAVEDGFSAPPLAALGRRDMAAQRAGAFLAIEKY